MSFTPGTAIIVVRPHVARRLRDHFQDDPGVVVYDASDAIPSVPAVATKAQTLLIIGYAFAETPAGGEFLARFREVNGTAEIRVLLEGAHGWPDLLQHPITRPAHLGLRMASRALDRVAGRRATRDLAPDSTEVLVNGVSATLVDLSPLGAQVISTTVLKPGERVQFRTSATSRVTATVVWSAFEIAPDTGRPHYRAGLEFASQRG